MQRTYNLKNKFAKRIIEMLFKIKPKLKVFYYILHFLLYVKYSDYMLLRLLYIYYIFSNTCIFRPLILRYKYIIVMWKSSDSLLFCVDYQRGRKYLKLLPNKKVVKL